MTVEAKSENVLTKIYTDAEQKRQLFVAKTKLRQEARKEQGVIFSKALGDIYAAAKNVDELPVHLKVFTEQFISENPQYGEATMQDFAIIFGTPPKIPVAWGDYEAIMNGTYTGISKGEDVAPPMGNIDELPKAASATAERAHRRAIASNKNEAGNNAIESTQDDTVVLTAYPEDERTIIWMGILQRYTPGRIAKTLGDGETEETIKRKLKSLREKYPELKNYKNRKTAS